MSNKQVEQVQPEPLPGLNWASMDIEQFRGEGLSFPIAIEIIISPAFTIFTLGTARNFNYYFQNTILDPEGEGFPINIKNKVTVNNETVSVQPGEIFLVLTYIDETQNVIVIDPTPTIH